MNNFDNRLERLERASGVVADPITSIRLVGIAPEQKGPFDMGCVAVWCLGELGFALEAPAAQ